MDVTELNLTEPKLTFYKLYFINSFMKLNRTAESRQEKRYDKPQSISPPKNVL